MTLEQTLSPDRILIVDDNLQNRLVAEGHLVGAGYTAFLAENGARALEIFQAQPPDLVLLDILMPGMDGFETCRRLRGLPGGQDTPIVFLTALADLATHETAMASGADDFLSKPINRTELMLRVKSLLRIKRISRDLRRSHEVVQSQHDALLRVQAQKDELIAFLVHDLKNPLAAILANVHYLVQESDLGVEDRQALLDVLSSTDSMHRMVMNLLDISRSEDGVLAAKFGHVDLTNLIEGICAAARRRVEDREVKLAAEIGVKAMRGDNDLLRRLIENLLDNCIKYTPPGSVIQIRVQPIVEDFVEIRVSDNGPGIPESYRDKIFGKYVQLDFNSEGQRRVSHGLGLTFCRLVAELHGGRIWVEDNVPPGKLFLRTHAVNGQRHEACVNLPTRVAITTAVIQLTRP